MNRTRVVGQVRGRLSMRLKAMARSTGKPKNKSNSAQTAALAVTESAKAAPTTGLGARSAATRDK